VNEDLDFAQARAPSWVDTASDNFDALHEVLERWLAVARDGFRAVPVYSPHAESAPCPTPH
jgi:hypothetical protein